MTAITDSLEKTIIEQGYLSALYECIQFVNHNHFEAGFYFGCIVKKLTLNLIIGYIKEKERDSVKQALSSKSAACKYLFYLFNLIDSKIICYQNLLIKYGLYLQFLNLLKAQITLQFVPEIVPALFSSTPFFVARSAIAKTPQREAVNYASAFVWKNYYCGVPAISSIPCCAA